MTDQPTKEQLEAILDTVFECGWEAGERYKEAKGGTTDVSDTLFKAKQDITALIQEAEADRAFGLVRDFVDTLEGLTPAKPEDLTQADWYKLVDAHQKVIAIYKKTQAELIKQLNSGDK